MKVSDLEFVRDTSMEVYRAKVQFGKYKMVVSLEKPSNMYAITVSTNEGFVNLENINPGVTVTSFLSESDVNQRLEAMEKYANENN